MTESNIELLVPMEVKALVVNFNGEEGFKETQMTPNYGLTQFGIFLGEKIAPPHFQESCQNSSLDKYPHSKSVRIHWALPDGLTQGHYKEDTKCVEYPTVPNRYLIVRYNPEDFGCFRSWVIESDRLTNPLVPSERSLIEKEGRSLESDFVTWPTLSLESIKHKNEIDKQTPYMYLGSLFDGNEWKKTRARRLNRLTAVAPGNLSFAAAYPQCKNIFGIEDTLNDLSKEELQNISTVSYVVVGWYSKGKQPQTPLNDISKIKDLAKQKEAFKSYLKKLKWKVEGNKIPRTLLCHGSLYRVNLREGSNGGAKTHTSDIKIAAGNTSIEALAALLEPGIRASGMSEEEIKHAMEVLEAAQYRLIDKIDTPDGIHALKHELHNQAFQNKSAGVSWDIIKVTQDGDFEDLKSKDKAPSFPEFVRTDFKTLNTLQRAYNKKSKELEEMRWNIYANWYRHMLQQLSPKSFSKSVDYKKLILAEKKPLEAHEASLKQDRVAIEMLVNKIKLSIQEKGYEIHHTPEPYFWSPNDPVILFAGLERAFCHGEDGRFSKNKTLHCRLSSQIIRSQSPLKHSCIKEKVFGTLVLKLIQESQLLDPDTNIGDKSFKITPLVAAERPDFDSKTIAKAGFLKEEEHYPSRTALSYWTSPWTPLFLQWEVEFTPSNIEEDWALDPELNDYTFIAKKERDQSSISTYSGCTPITPHAVSNFKASLEDYLKNSPDKEHFKELSAITNELEKLNILSQSLGGFNEALQQRKSTLQFPIFDPYDSDLMSLVTTLTQNEIAYAPKPGYVAHPIRAGKLRLLKLHIIDSFGLRQEMQVNNKHIRINQTSRLLGNMQETESLYLPPRFSQPARIHFRWISENSDNEETSSDPHSSPISGWLLHNYLNKSLMLFDSSGFNMGVIETVPEVTFTPSPNAEAKSNEKLSKLQKELLAQKSLSHFLSHVDTAKKFIEPQGSKLNVALPSLMGQPLALIRAQIKLETYGNFEYEMSQGIPLYLGDMAQFKDGLIGYFKGDHFSTFYTTYNFEEDPQENPNSNDFIQHNQPITLIPNAPPLELTLLMDPRAGVHAITGVLPTKYIEISQKTTLDALSNMKIAFRMGPVLTEGELAMPLPSCKNTQKWEWQSSLKQEGLPIKTANDRARFPEVSPKAKEGWLKLILDQTKGGDE